MQVKVAAQCQACQKEEAVVLAVFTGSPKLAPYIWHLGPKCYGSGEGWEKVGDYKPIIKSVDAAKEAAKE